MATVIWLTGLSGSGKTTIALKLKEEFHRRRLPFELLDGDVVRDFFENDLGYSRKERILNVKRIAFAAKLLSEHGINVIVANIAPYYEVRDFIRRHIKKYVQVYVKASQETLIKRDVQGHYAKVNNGVLNNMIGVDDVYDIPRNPDVIVNTDCETVDESLNHIMVNLSEKGVL